jgi:ParB-like chromosome segregation protein Spo0J
MKRTKPQRVDPQQVKQFLADAQKKTSNARKNLAIDAEIAYQIAYEAMLKASLVLMLSHGERPRVQLGHHIAIIEFAQQHLDPSLEAIFALFDRMRRKRNDAFYAIAIISDTEAEEAVQAAERYLKLITAEIAKRLPR